MADRPAPRCAARKPQPCSVLTACQAPSKLLPYNSFNPDSPARSALPSTSSEEKTGPRELSGLPVAAQSVVAGGRQDESPGCLVPEPSELCPRSASEETCPCSYYCFKNA